LIVNELELVCPFIPAKLFFTHSAVSTLDRVAFQLTDEQDVYWLVRR
tara:strand:- start:725 stop:865 length:141 start_codon:yes stop_codon:yes gene_type:complete